MMIWNKKLIKKVIFIQTQEVCDPVPYHIVTDVIQIFQGFWLVNISSSYGMACTRHVSTISSYDKNLNVNVLTIGLWLRLWHAL